MITNRRATSCRKGSPDARSYARALTQLLACCLLVACGGGGNGSLEDNAPAAEFLFPTNESTVDAAVISVVIRATDDHPAFGDAPCPTQPPLIPVEITKGTGVAKIVVNDVKAVQLDPAGGPLWVAQVPLMPGANTLDAVVTDAVGNAAPTLSIVVHNRSIPDPATAIVRSPGTTPGLLMTTRYGVLFVDDATKMISLISGPLRGTGAAFGTPCGLAVENVNRVWVSDKATKTLVTVDLDDEGARVLASGLSVGTGTALGTPGGLVFDPGGPRILVTDTTSKVIWAVDPANGNRTLFSGKSGMLTEGAELPSLAAPIALDAANGRVAIYVPTTQTILAVDLTNGAQTKLSTATTAPAAVGTGPALGTDVTGLAFNPAGTTLFVTRAGRDPDVLAIATATGDRTVHSSGPANGTPSLHGPRAVIHDATLSTLVVGDFPAGLLAMDEGTGARAVHATFSVGTGAAFDEVSGCAFDHRGHKLYVLERERGEVFKMDVDTALPTMLASGLTHPVDVEYDCVNGRLIVSAAGDAMAMIDPGLFSVPAPTAGAVTLISGVGQGVGPPLSSANGIFLAEGAGTVLLVDGVAGRLFDVALGDGDRTLISSLSRGTGDAPILWSDVAPVGSTLHVLDEGADKVIAVDPDLGNRTTLTTPDKLVRPRTVIQYGTGSRIGGSTPRPLEPEANPMHFSLGAVAGLAAWGDQPVVFGTDRARGAVFVIYVTTGERALLWN